MICSLLICEKLQCLKNVSTSPGLLYLIVFIRGTRTSPEGGQCGGFFLLLSSDFNHGLHYMYGPLRYLLHVWDQAEKETAGVNIIERVEFEPVKRVVGSRG